MRNPLWSLRKRWARRASFPQLIEHEGAKFIVDPRNWIDNRLIARVPYETAQLAEARRLVETRGIDTFLDIGANFGLYSILIGSLPQVSRVHAFEPVRRNYNQLCANIYANGLDAKVIAHHCGLGDAGGQVTIHIDPRSTGVSRLDLGSTDRNASVFTQSETIAIRRGDDCLPLEGQRIFAKIDVEGHASEVVRGLQHLLARNSGALQVEVSPQESGVIAMLEQAGWRSAGVIDSDRYFTKE